MSCRVRVRSCAGGAGGFARRRRGRGDRRRCAAIGGSGGAGKDRVTSRKTSTASPDRCCSGGGLFVVVFGQVAVEGGAADAEGRCDLLDRLAGGESGPGRGELVRVELAGPAGLLALGLSDIFEYAGSSGHRE